MTTPDLTGLGLDASQEAMLRAMLAQAYRRGYDRGRRDLSAVPDPLTGGERVALLAELGTS